MELSRRPRQHQKSDESDVERAGACAEEVGAGLFTPGLIASDLPKQKMVGAVVPSDRFTAIGESEVLVAVAAGNDQMVGF